MPVSPTSALPPRFAALFLSLRDFRFFSRCLLPAAIYAADAAASAAIIDMLSAIYSRRYMTRHATLRRGATQRAEQPAQATLRSEHVCYAVLFY